MTRANLIRTADPSGRVQLRRGLRDRWLMWGRTAVAGVAAGVVAALGAPSLPGAVAVGLASAGVASLGVEGLHHVLKSRAVGAASIRSEVAHNPTLAYCIPLPGVVAIVDASTKGVPGTDVILVIAGAAAFTWVAWEAAIRVVSRSQVAYRFVTNWRVKASKVHQNQLAAAESRWRDRDW
ncbi:MAG: hypothetical protein WA751_00395 [Candidatus Dormiibacterota bacterium]